MPSFIYGQKREFSVQIEVEFWKLLIHIFQWLLEALLCVK